MSVRLKLKSTLRCERQEKSFFSALGEGHSKGEKEKERERVS